MTRVSCTKRRSGSTITPESVLSSEFDENASEEGKGMRLGEVERGRMEGREEGEMKEERGRRVEGRERGGMLCLSI